MDTITLLNLGQVVLFSMSVPLACIAAWGYRRTPFGRVVLGLPMAAVGFTMSGAAELLGEVGAFGYLWVAGSILGVAGFAWFAFALVLVLHRGNRFDPITEVLS